MRAYTRRGALMLVALVFVLPLRSSAQTSSADDLVVDGAALAGAGTAIGHVNPDFDFWPIYSSTRIDNDASHGLSGAFWPGFLVDAFLFLYDAQAEGRAAMGISETQWPNRPHEAEASSSAFMLNNFAEGCRFFADQLGLDGCEQLAATFRDPPGVVGHSSSHSGSLEGDGSSRGTRFSVPGVFAAEEARSQTSARFEDGASHTASVFEARDLLIGGELHISQLVARSQAAAGDESSADSTLALGGVTFAGQDATIDDQGVHLTEDPASSAANDFLGAQGIEVRLVRGAEETSGDGSLSRASSGGLLIRFARERAAEDVPPEFRDGYDQLCRAAADSPLNQEITNIRQSFDNPFYGTVPFLPMPRSLEVEQSVPPPTSCPFLNRSFEVAFVLGLTEASARAVELPTFTGTLGALEGAPTGGVDQPAGPAGIAGRSDPPRSGTTTDVVGAPADATETDEVTLAGGPSDGGGIPSAVETLYIVFMIGLGLAIAGRFVLKEVSSP